MACCRVKFTFTFTWSSNNVKKDSAALLQSVKLREALSPVNQVSVLTDKEAGWAPSLLWTIWKR